MGLEIESKWLMEKKPEGLKEIVNFISRQWYFAYHDTVVRLTEYMDPTCYQAISPEKLFPYRYMPGTTTPWIMTVKTNPRPQMLMVETDPTGNIINNANCLMVRQESEYYLSFIDFQNIINKIREAPIIVNVTLYELPDGKILEYKEVDKALPTGRNYAEIEFDTVEECEAYELKIPYIKDVTLDPDHKMKRYWANTRGTK